MTQEKSCNGLVWPQISRSTQRLAWASIRVSAKSQWPFLSTTGQAALKIHHRRGSHTCQSPKLRLTQGCDFAQSASRCQLKEDIWWRLKLSFRWEHSCLLVLLCTQPTHIFTARRLHSARSASARRSRWPPGDIWRSLHGPAAGQRHPSFSCGDTRSRMKKTETASHF